MTISELQQSESIQLREKLSMNFPTALCRMECRESLGDDRNRAVVGIRSLVPIGAAVVPSEISYRAMKCP